MLDTITISDNETLNYVLKHVWKPSLANAAANNTKFCELIHTDENLKHLECNNFVVFANGINKKTTKI